MTRQPPVTATVILAFLLVAMGTCAAGEVTVYKFYQPNVTVAWPSQAAFSPGSTVDFTVTINNSEFYVLDGYIVTTQAYSAVLPNPVNSNLTDGDTYVSRTVTKIKVASGETKTIALTETVPADARPGKWRIDAYVMMNNTNIYGNYVSYAPWTWFSYNVTGGGNHPKASILRTQTHAAGGFSQSGPAVPETTPIRGYVGLKNTDETEFTGQLEISYCTFDDYMGNCTVSQTLDVTIPAGKTSGTAYAITESLERGIYTIRYRLLEAGKEVCEYKNRVIIAGKTINIISIDAYKESYEKGKLVMVRTSFTGPYFPAQDEVKNVVATTTVYDNSGNEIYSQADNYSSAKPDDIIVRQYAFGAPSDLEGYTACLEVAGDGAADKKSCAAFGKAATAQQPTPTQVALPTVQPTVGAPAPSEAPISTPPAKAGNDNATAYAALIVAIAAIVAYWLYKNQKPPVAAAILLLLAVMPLASAVNCPNFQYNYDKNNNTVVDGTDPAVTVITYGPETYLPLNTIVTAPGQCTYQYTTSYTYYTTEYLSNIGYACSWYHACGNTAGGSYCYSYTYLTPYQLEHTGTQVNTGYYTHYVTVSRNPITYSDTLMFADNTTALTKQRLVDMIKEYTFTDISFLTAAGNGIYSSLTASSLPNFPFATIENDTTKVDNYVMNTILKNHCSKPVNNCTYKNESSAYGIYNYTTYQYSIRNFTINNHTIYNLPVNYTHQNGTNMRLRTNYTVNNYRVDNYALAGPVSGPYEISYTLHNIVYTYRPNGSNVTYSYTLPEYDIPSYTITGYTVDSRPTPHEYYVKWESLFTELFNDEIITLVIIPTSIRTIGASEVVISNARTYRVTEPGLYFLSHTYA